MVSSDPLKEAALKWTDRLERHLGFLAIPNLMLYVVGGQALTTLLGFKDNSLPLQLILDPEAVARGQYWRLITWAFVPNLGLLNGVFAIFWFLFLWSVGQAMEASWGSLRATLYILLGVALPAVGTMLLWQAGGPVLILTGGTFSISLLLAAAALAPETTLYLFFILPVKLRWVAWALGVYLAYEALTGGISGMVEVVFGVGNYLLFFVPEGIEAWRLRKQVAAGRRVFAAAKVEGAKVAQRACAQCGAGPSAELRLCTCPRCGEHGRDWCAEHLGPHLGRPAEAEPPLPPKEGRPAAPKTKRKG
jgi:hypothetical protein